MAYVQKNIDVAKYLKKANYFRSFAILGYRVWDPMDAPVVGKRPQLRRDYGSWERHGI